MHSSSEENVGFSPLCLAPSRALGLRHVQRTVQRKTFLTKQACLLEVKQDDTLAEAASYHEQLECRVLPHRTASQSRSAGASGWLILPDKQRRTHCMPTNGLEFGLSHILYSRNIKDVRFRG